MASLSELYRKVHQYSRDILRRRCGRAFQSEQYSALLIELHPRLSCSQRRKESLGGISRATCDLTVPHLPTPPATSATDSSQYQATAAQYIRSVPMRVQGYTIFGLLDQQPVCTTRMNARYTGGREAYSLARVVAERVCNRAHVLSLVKQRHQRRVRQDAVPSR